MNVAGINVSHKTVTLVIDRDGRTRKPCEFKNTTHGYQTLVNRLRKANVSRVCLEATGLYHPALALDDAGLDLTPRSPNASLRQCLRRTPRAMPSMPRPGPIRPALCPSSPGSAPTT